MGFTRSPLPQNNGNLPLPFFGGNGERVNPIYDRISRWYIQETGGQAPLSREHLDWIAMEREELYRCRPPEGLQVTIMVTPAAMENGVP